MYINSIMKLKHESIIQKSFFFFTKFSWYIHHTIITSYVAHYKWHKSRDYNCLKLCNGNRGQKTNYNHCKARLHFSFLFFSSLSFFIFYFYFFVLCHSHQTCLSNNFFEISISRTSYAYQTPKYYRLKCIVYGK